MPSKLRTLRLAEQIRQDLQQLLLQDVTDPALAGITVTDVEVDREMAFAKIYVSTLEGSERKQEVLEGLQRARGYLRFQLAQLIELRTFPQLVFKWDSTAERAQRIEQLFKTIEAENEAGKSQKADTTANAEEKDDR